MKTSIEVTFSGSDKPYLYTTTVQGQIGQRVVVPTKMKADGTVTLTIATVSEIHDTLHEGAVKPIVMLIPFTAIEHARQVVAELEALAEVVA